MKNLGGLSPNTLNEAKVRRKIKFKILILYLGHFGSKNHLTLLSLLIESTMTTCPVPLFDSVWLTRSVVGSRVSKTGRSLQLSSAFKGIGSVDEYFLKAYKIQSVLSVHEQMVFKWLACLVQERIISWSFCLLLWKHLLFEKTVPEASFWLHLGF